ncbi:uncharacterized protein LOC127878807 [Dreissena polymorpha]|uniref:uncharacterized protein LOC127878807 n=1 Tax=Dreissena polymorpha TaxID=45954 RepID=UPI0022640F8D|nr:uncharacterized protein LOC127878807 [Dreissena polymorpha]
MADDAVRSVLHSIGLHSLHKNFMSQKIDSIEICKSLEDNQLTNLGLVTIGERIKFKNAVQHWQSMPIMPMAESDTAASGSRISTDATLRERNSLFMPSRCRQPSTSTSVGKRKRPRTWTANFMCLSNNHQNKVPNSAEKECLYKAGLGLKKVTFEGDAKEQSVHDTLIKAFTKLEQCGGFELLHCNSSCRELKKLNCKWDVKTLKSVVGPQGKFYIRPIQKCLTVEVVTEDEETELMTKCDICKQDVSLGQIRNHVESCIATNLDHTGTYLYTSQGNSDEELPESASEIIHQQGFSMEFHDLPEIASITSMVTLDNVLPGSEDQHNGDYLSTIVKKCTTFCKSNDVSDPIHVLKIFQKEIVTGRPLELTEETSSTGIYGETNFILVDRGDLLKTAIEEIRAISDMRKCLEVQFYGECAADFGGPRKEFFSLVLHCIKEEYFEPVREWSDDYEAVGRILRFLNSDI